MATLEHFSTSDKNDWISVAAGSGAVQFVQDWPLAANPVYPLTTIVTYLFLIHVGQNWMKDRKPFALRGLMIFHNFALVAFSTFIFYKLLICSFLRSDFHLASFICEGPDADVPCSYTLAVGMWWWHVSKLCDLMDTAYLVLRKRNVSVLHAYHHTSVVFLSWIMLKYLPSGSSVFGPLMNNFVHMIMYTYYGLAAIGPHMQKYLWWKRYLTKIQMIQFVILFTWTCSALLVFNCSYPAPWIILQAFYCVSLFALFGNFYYQTYVSRRNKKTNGEAAAGMRTTSVQTAPQNAEKNGELRQRTQPE